MRTPLDTIRPWLPRVLTLTLLGLGGELPLSAQGREDFKQDFTAAWRVVADEYAYFDAKATHWADVPRLYAADLERLATREDLIALLEKVVDELYDPHTQLNVNLATSPRLVPSGADLWAEWRAGQAVITDVRAGSDAERAGIRSNDVVESVDGTPIAEAVDLRMGRSYPRSTPRARDWALLAVLAGRHNTPRSLRSVREGALREVELAARDQFDAPAAEPVSHSRLAPDLGWVRFNDSLGDESTIAELDRALGALRETRALIVDLRDTPSGGNSIVARGILGRFVTRELPYQRHELPAEERETGVRRSWLELVSPRGPFTYQGRVAVLVGHWTGSMGEGLAIGFDATGAATVIGTAMAGLVGATERIVLPHTGIGLNLPTERLYHVDGTPREAFQPRVLVDVTSSSGDPDPFVSAARRVVGF